MEIKSCEAFIDREKLLSSDFSETKYSVSDTSLEEKDFLLPLIEVLLEI